MPVDQYVGGIEHATMHLIYSRFFTKVLADLDMLEGVREPFENLLTQGMVRKGGTAMSSSTGNVVSPRPFVEKHGADTGRLFMLEAARPEKDFDWTEEGARSAHEFLQGVYALAAEIASGAVGKAGADADADRAPIDEYVAREVSATAATATEEFEAFRFNHALQAVRELVSLVRRYRDETTPDPAVVERGVETVTKLLAPVAPHVAEEMWDELGGEGLVAEADWPDATPPEGYDIERRLVENTREDVREIADVAGIDDPERIRIVVAPEWKHAAHDLALESDADDLVGEVMGREQFRQHGNEAASFAKDLQAEREALTPALSAAEEVAALERARWLVEREFDATVTVEAADDAPDLADDAEPGRPAIRID